MASEIVGSTGWIGTGAMGQPMADRLVGNGVPLAVWNRTRAKTDELAEHGATVVDSVSDLAGAEVVFVILSDPEATKRVLHGPAGLLTAPVKPAIVVDCSTMSQADAAALRSSVTAAGVQYLSAPIASPATMIRAGSAAIIASGPRSAFDQVRERLEMIAPTTLYAGPGDEALIVKVGSEVLMGAFTVALYEIADVVLAAGVDVEAFFDFVDASLVGSPYSRFKAGQYLANEKVLPPDLRRFRRRSLDDFAAVANGVGVPIPVGALIRELS